jgi:KaiC/GvpD/RAD55 family RecA-like ATPase
MKIDSIRRQLKYKVLLRGDTGTGKTHCALMVASKCSERGDKVIYIDPEYGTQKEIIALYESGKISDESLANITMVITPRYDGKVEKVDDGMYRGGFRQAYKKVIKSDADLIVLDSVNEVMELHRRYLEGKFISQGYYVIGEKVFNITDSDTFTLPWQSYNKLYDDLLKVIYDMVDLGYNFICTSHPIGDTKTRERLESSVFRKFDTIIDMGVEISNNEKRWYGIIRKNRGKDVYARIKEVDKLLVKMFVGGDSGSE